MSGTVAVSPAMTGEHCKHLAAWHPSMSFVDGSSWLARVRVKRGYTCSPRPGAEGTYRKHVRDVSCTALCERDVNLTTNGRIGLLVAQVLGSCIVAFFAYRYLSYACFLVIWKGLSLAGVYRGEVGDLISQYFLRLSGFLGFCVGLVP
jgi:hypothetical protein